MIPKIHAALAVLVLLASSAAGQRPDPERFTVALQPVKEKVTRPRRIKSLLSLLGGTQIILKLALSQIHLLTLRLKIGLLRGERRLTRLEILSASG